MITPALEKRNSGDFVDLIGQDQINRIIMSKIADRILAREQMMHDKIIHSNSNRALLLALAPDGWEELKKLFRSECEVISEQSQLLQLECDEPDDQSFQINQVLLSGHIVGALQFKFEKNVPRILWRDLKNAKPWKTIDLVIDGSSIFFAEGKRGLDLSQFAERRLLDITRTSE